MSPRCEIATATATFSLLSATFLAAGACAQQTDDPFSEPISTSDAITVDFREFAEIPDFEGGPPRMMEMKGAPGTDRLFLVDMWGILYAVSSDGETVTEYLDLNDSRWGV